MQNVPEHILNLHGIELYLRGLGDIQEDCWVVNLEKG